MASSNPVIDVESVTTSDASNAAKVRKARRKSESRHSRDLTEAEKLQVQKTTEEVTSLNCQVKALTERVGRMTEKISRWLILRWKLFRSNSIRKGSTIRI